MPGFDDFFQDKSDAERAEQARGTDAPASAGEPGSSPADVPADRPEPVAGAPTEPAGAPGPGGFEAAFDGEPFDSDQPASTGVVGAGAGAATATRVRRRRRKQSRSWRTVLIVLLVTVTFLGVAAVGGAYLLLRHYSNNVTRLHNVFPSTLPGVSTPVPRPTKVVANATNMLLVGSDSRASQQTTGSGGNSTALSPIGSRSDTMMLVHIDAAKNAAWVVSIPRDSWVPIPGHGTNKINAAYAWGGPALMVATVEQLTHVHIDHYAEIDFDGFKAMTDALGGVDVRVSHSFSAFGVKFVQGMMHMNGTQALAFVRDRHNQPGSDFGRINDQHTFLLALMQKATSLSLLTNPLKINDLINAITQNVSVDDSLGGTKLYSFVLSMSKIKPSNVQFLTIPVKGTGMVGDQSVVFTDPTNDAILYNAIVHDTMQSWTPPS